LKSRAAYKLLEIHTRHTLFRPGDTVVDLGFAPGSWSQVAANRTAPGGRVVGVDVVPAAPPPGVSTLQGNFLSEGIREEVRKFVREGRGWPERRGRVLGGEGVTEEELEALGRGIVEVGKDEAAATGVVRRRREEAGEEQFEGVMREMKKGGSAAQRRREQQAAEDEAAGRVVDVVLSDMCEPWPLATATWVNSVSNPWRRMMNTSGMAFRDHAGSMVCPFLPSCIKFSVSVAVFRDTSALHIDTIPYPLFPSPMSHHQIQPTMPL